MNTAVRINKIYPNVQNSLKAFASINFDECFVVDGIRVLDGKNGLYIAMPSQKLKNGEYKDIAFPITKEFRQELSDMVLEAYQQKLEAAWDEKKENKQDEAQVSEPSAEHFSEQEAEGEEFEGEAEMSMGM